MSGYYLSGSLDAYFQQQAEDSMDEDEHYERCRCGGCCRDCRKKRDFDLNDREDDDHD